MNTPLPSGMTTPHTAHAIIFTIVSVVLALLFLGSLWRWKTTGRPTMTLLILGGFICCLDESTGDIMGHCYFPTDMGIAQHLLGRGIPLWVDVTYAIYFGAFPYFLYLALKTGWSRPKMWGAICSFWVANLILELPLLHSNLYVYYGYQPLVVGGFPLFWLTINCLGAFFTAVVAIRAEPWLTGRRQLLLLAVPFATYMSSWVVDMPGFWALNSDASKGVKTLGVGVAIALGVLAIDALIRIGVSAPAVERAPEPSQSIAAAREFQVA